MGYKIVNEINIAFKQLAELTHRVDSPTGCSFNFMYCGIRSVKSAIFVGLANYGT